jgi:hypothetical protein
VLNVGDGPLNQVTVLLVVAHKYAPADRRLLSATLLGEQPADDESPAEAVRETLTAWYPKNSFEALCLHRTDRIEFAQPGFRADLPAVDEPDGRVHFTSEYTTW